MQVFLGQFHIATMSPAFRIGVAIAALLGAATTTYPLGVRVDNSGEGALAGAANGTTTGAVVAVFVAAAIAATHAGWDEQVGTSRQLFLSGILSRRRRAGWIVASTSAAVALVPAGALGGALAALGRSVRGGPVLGEGWLPVAGVVLGVLAALFVATIGVGAASALRGAAPALLAIIGGFTVFILLLSVFERGTPARWLLRLSPFGPLWSSALPAGRSGLVLDMSVPLRAIVVLAWSALAVGAVLRGRAPEGGRAA